MKLETFGRVRLERSGFSRPKPLLLLAYVALEGPQERRRLAELFWLEGEPQKRLGQLSVVLSQFKKEGAAGVIPDKPGLDPIPLEISCDALEFVEQIEKGELEAALDLYKGSFLHDLGKPLMDLEVSPELLDWVLEQREILAQKAQMALIQLAENAVKNDQKREARTFAERAYNLPDAPQMEPVTLSRLQHLLAQSESKLARNLESDLKTGFEDLSPAAQQVFLALALQPNPNLTITRNALKLSLSDISQAREELILGGFISSNTVVLAGDMARSWLEQHPAERIPLLLSLARATPPEQAFLLYQQIHQSTHGFGGAGDFPRARTAYVTYAQALMQSLKFAETLEVLGGLRAAEQVAEAEPDSQARFLEAYALERLGRFKEALNLTADIPEAQHTPNMLALRSVLLWRTGKSPEAKAAADQTVQSGLDWIWAKATGNITLGYLALSDERFLDAASLFKKAASLYLTAGEKNRWVGSLNNHAMALDELAQLAEREGQDKSKLEALHTDAELAYQQTLQALAEAGDNPTLRARVLLNLGWLWERRKQWERAEEYYLEAQEYAAQANTLEISARLYLNLGMVYLGQQKGDLARNQFSKAIACAAQAGEFLIQGMAVGNLAFLDNDPDGIEVAMDLLKQGNQLDTLAIYTKDYETVLARNVEKALEENNSPKALRLLGKLNELYCLLGIREKSEQVSTAQNAMLSQNLAPVKHLLLGLIGKNPSQMELNGTH